MKRYLFLGVMLFSHAQAMLPRVQKVMKRTAILQKSYKAPINLEELDENRNTPLIWAVNSGNHEYVAWLCDYAQQEMKSQYRFFMLRQNSNGRTALGNAIEVGNFEMVKTLIKAFGSNPRVYMLHPEGLDRELPLHIAVKCASAYPDCYSKYQEIIKFLLEKSGPDAPYFIIALDGDGRPPYSYADPLTLHLLEQELLKNSCTCRPYE